MVAINSSVLHVASPCQNFLPKFLHVVEILTTDGVLLVALLDDGSDSCFLTFDAAERMGLRGKKEMSLIETAGNEPVAKETQRFDFFILKNSGESVAMSCLGLGKITSNNSENINLDPAYELFPHVPKGSFKRPSGPIDMLIGQDHASLLASGGQGSNLVENLRAMHVPFGSGWVLGGSHPKISCESLYFSDDLKNVRASNFSSIVSSNHASSSVCSNFPEILDIPLQPPRKYLCCRNCQSCHYEHEEASRKEQELDLIRKNTWLDREKQRCFTKYPIIKDTSTIMYNEKQAVAITTNLRKHLVKNDNLEAYEKEIHDYLDRGVLVNVQRNLQMVG